MKLKDGFILRKIGPTSMVVPYGARANEVGGMLTLSETGHFLWQAMEDGADSLPALVERLCATYDVDRETAGRDIAAFLEQLQVQGALET